VVPKLRKTKSGQGGKIFRTLGVGTYRVMVENSLLPKHSCQGRQQGDSCNHEKNQKSAQRPERKKEMGGSSQTPEKKTGTQWGSQGEKPNVNHQTKKTIQKNAGADSRKPAGNRT